MLTTTKLGRRLIEFHTLIGGSCGVENGRNREGLVNLGSEHWRGKVCEKKEVSSSTLH